MGGSKPRRLLKWVTLARQMALSLKSRIHLSVPKSESICSLLSYSQEAEGAAGVRLVPVVWIRAAPCTSEPWFIPSAPGHGKDMNNILFPSGFHYYPRQGLYQKENHNNSSGLSLGFARDCASFIFKDFFNISSLLPLPKSHLSHFLHPGEEPKPGGGLQNQNHVFEREMDQSPGVMSCSPARGRDAGNGAGGFARSANSS